MSPQPEKPVWGIVPRIIGIGNDEPGEESQSGCVAPSKLDPRQQADYLEICKVLSSTSSQQCFQTYIKKLYEDPRGGKSSYEKEIRQKLTPSLCPKFDQLLRELKHPI